jgi:hypothetical protein
VGAAGSWSRSQVPRSGSPRGLEALGGQPPTVYMAVCTQQHSTDAPGVDANGNWNSGVQDDCQAAFATAAAHEHTVDRVEAITGPVGIPITGC